MSWSSECLILTVHFLKYLLFLILFSISHLVGCDKYMYIDYSVHDDYGNFLPSKFRVHVMKLSVCQFHLIHHPEIHTILHNMHWSACLVFLANQIQMICMRDMYPLPQLQRIRFYSRFSQLWSMDCWSCEYLESIVQFAAFSFCF